MNKTIRWIFGILIVIIILFIIIQYVIPNEEDVNNQIDTESDDVEEVEGEELDLTDINCEADTYNCLDFNDCDEAMEVFDACLTDIHKLDKNDDDIPCESLCG